MYINSMAEMAENYWFPPSRESWETLLSVWRIGVPVFASLQYRNTWYGMGKTSEPSRWNLPGKLAWCTMECPGFLTLLYLMKTLPAMEGLDGLPWQNWVLGGLFVGHYLYRAVLFPLWQPSMAPIHVVIWFYAICFQVANGTSIGCWLAGYGPVDEAAWTRGSATGLRFYLGVALFLVGLAGNYYHDEALREIRRQELRRQARIHQGDTTGQKSTTARHYQIPEAGLFRYMLYPHYFMEWVEWTGFWMAAGWACAPAQAFLVNEVAAMLPRAWNGRKWYADRFGEEKIRHKWTIIPGLV